MLTARAWSARPSALLAIDDPYAAYCVDACGAYILARLKEGRKPDFGARAARGETTNARAMALLGRWAVKK